METMWERIERMSLGELHDRREKLSSVIDLAIRYKTKLDVEIGRREQGTAQEQDSLARLDRILDFAPCE